MKKTKTLESRRLFLADFGDFRLISAKTAHLLSVFQF